RCPDSPSAALHVPARSLWRSRRSPRGNRNLRCDGVLGRRAHQGNRYPDGAGRTRSGCPQDGAPASDVDDWHRAARRVGVGAGGYPGDSVGARRGDRDRSGDICGCDCGPGLDRSDRVPRSDAPGDLRGSDGSVEIRAVIMNLTRWLRWRTDLESAQEIDAHLQLEIQSNLDRGLTPEEARTAALRQFGNRTRVEERGAEAAPLFAAAQIWTDLKYHARALLRRPGVGTAVICSLALGIGANTLIFSIVNSVLLGSLPLPDADRLVGVGFTPSTQPDRKTGTNPLGYFTIRDENSGFESVGAVRLNAAFNVGEDSANAGGRIRVPAQWFTFDLAKVVGVNPVIGRWPSPDDPLSIVISDGLWRRLYGGASDVLGKKLRVDAFVVTVVGVMPPGFELVNSADFWLFQTDDALRTALRSNSRIYTVVARLKRGITLEQAQADMAKLAPRPCR